MRYGEKEIREFDINKILLIAEIKFKDLIQSHRSYAINIDHLHTIEKDYEKLWTVSFYDYSEKAKLGYNYRKQIISSLEVAKAAGEICYTELPNFTLEVPREKSHGDFATNCGMLLAKQAKIGLNTALYL